MSQQVSAAPATYQVTPQAPQAQQAAVGVSGRLREAVRAGLAGTPGRMRVLLGVSVVVTIVFGIIATQAFRQTDGAVNRADANTAQLVRVQEIHTNLVRANATATNAFLVGGLEPVDQRATYTTAIAETSRLIAEAAEHQPADAAALGALNQTVVTYSGLIEQARANNRQGLPVGAQYLREATTLLRDDALPVLDALVTANSDRVNQEFDRIGDGRGWLGFFGLLTLVVLAGVMVWLAHRTHRFVNLPLAGAAAVVLLTVLVGSSGLSIVNGTAQDARETPYAATLAVAQARIAAYDARSNESLTLIARGSGSQFEERWKTSAETVLRQLTGSARLLPSTPNLPNAWTQYTSEHQKVRSADDNGRWEEAVKRSVDGPAKAAFAEFDRTSAGVLTGTSTETRTELQGTGGWLAAAGWLGIPIGLVAALLCWLGLAQRLEEYR